MTSEFDPNQHLGLYQRANELQLPIDSTNQRFDTIESLIDDVEFQDIAKNGLRAEQLAAVTKLRQEVDLEPYEEVAVAYNKLAHNLEVSQIVLAGIREQMTDEQRRFDSLAEMVKQIAPLGTQEAEELATRRKSEIELARASDIRENIAKTEAAMNLYGLVIEESGKAWPIPRLLVDAVPPQQEYVTDEIPVEPTMRPSQFKRYEKISDRHIDAPEASKYVALYLSENSGLVVDTAQLVDFLYPDVTDRQDRLPSRITTLLGPMTSGHRIQEMLVDEEIFGIGNGMVLQYGWRRKIDPMTGKQTSPRTRIYRALRIEDIETVDEVITTFNVVDSFEVSESLPEIVEPEINGHHADSELERAVEAPQETIEEETVTEVIHSTPPPRLVTQRRSHSSVAKKTPPATPERKTRVTWQSDFKLAIGAAIDQLEADNLMNDESIAANMVSVRSSSTIMGTQTAIERMEAVGLISTNGLPRQNKQKYPLTVVDRVIMSMFNTQSHNFSERSRKKKALQMVEEAVNSYLDKQTD